MNESRRTPEPLLSGMEALSDPVRLRLLRLLERHELGVAEMTDVLQMPQSSVSRHLKLLMDRGLVRSRSRGTTNLYRMQVSELPVAARRLWLVAREQTEGWATLQHDRLRLERRLAQRQRDSQAFFAGAVSRWDRLRRELYGEAFTRSALAALLPGEAVVADLACGTGTVAAEIAPHVARVIAVDQSPAMLAAARKRAARLPNVELLRGDLASLPIPDATCDAALLLLALTYVAEPQPAVDEMARILKPGGRAVVVDLLGHDRDDFRREMGQLRPGFEPVALRSLLAEAGLVGAACRELPTEAGARGPALLLASASRANANTAVIDLATRETRRAKR
jgi:ubiquinone/menaquinone biosynthesis C-methylase UbiE/DNA-binding transcriptional ArsR family regulator